MPFKVGTIIPHQNLSLSLSLTHMSTTSRASRPEGGSGGKIVRQRRRRSPAASSPYSRPDPPSSSRESRSSSWFAALLAPASRLVASSAGRLISSVFGRGDSPSSSSASASSSSGDDEDIDLILPQESELNPMVPEINVNSGALLQPLREKSEAKLAIERLLQQETFSRDEYMHFTGILESRVVDNLTPYKPGDGDAAVVEAHRLVETSKKSRKEWESRFGISPGLAGLTTTTPTTPDLCITAVMEAKKWRDNWKLKSSPSLQMDHGPCTLNTFVLPNNYDESDVGCPSDLAKSYMQGRPSCMSPSIGYSGLKTPTSVGSLLLGDEISNAVATESVPTIKGQKRNSLAAEVLEGLDDSRRIRQKLVEDIVDLPSDVREPSPPDLENNDRSMSLNADGKLAEATNLPANSTRLLDEGSKSDACDVQDGTTKNKGSPDGDLPGEEPIGEKLVGGVHSCEQLYDMVAASEHEMIVKDSEESKDSKQATDSHSVSDESDSKDSRLLQHASINLDQDGQDLGKEGGSSELVVDKIADNGFKSSMLGSSGVDEEAASRGPDVACLGPANSSNDASVMQSCGLLTESLVKVPADPFSGPVDGQPNHGTGKLEEKAPAKRRAGLGTKPSKRTGATSIAGRGRGRKAGTNKGGQGRGAGQEAWK